jgi:predicted amidohydrolase
MNASIDLSKLRNWEIIIEGKKLLLFPEFELTDYPPQLCMNAHMAKACMRHSTADISIAGFVETAGKKQFSSCVVIDGRNEYIVRKFKPFHTEVGAISGNDEKPHVLPLSIGRTR